MFCCICDTLLWAGGVLVILLALGWWTNGYFRRRGVKNPPAYLPLIGNMWTALTRKEHFIDRMMQYYSMFPEERYIGVIRFFTPMVVVRDVELLKQICIKDFDYFLDHHGTINENGDLLFGRGLFTLQGQKWRDMRGTLSPAFTSSKMRGMSQLVFDCGQQVVDYLSKEMLTEENKVRGLLEVEMKDIFTRYTNDVIATAAFGLHVDSFVEKENTFYVTGKDATDFSGMRMFKLLFLMTFPRLAKLMKINFLPQCISDFFRNLVWDTIKNREENHVVRPDMIQLLMEARKGTLKYDSQDDIKEGGFAVAEEFPAGKTPIKKEWEDDDIVGQAVAFFTAGFDTSSVLACFMAHELALNPGIQKILYEEMLEIVPDGKLTYDCLHKMKYMDMVVCESLRKWPPFIETDRKCVKPYILPPPNKNSSEGLKLETGSGITIPIYAFHHDPKYWENPEKFDPERFSDENKSKIVPGTFLAFGFGPRNCIGSRFALMEVKAVMFKILSQFEIVTTAKTQDPIKLNNSTFSMHAESGFWVGLKRREK